MAGRVIKQGTFTCMLLLSILLVYTVSIAGVQAGRLKKDISWAHPLFVALFNREYVSVPDAGDAENAVVENGGYCGCTDGGDAESDRDGRNVELWKYV